MCLSTHLCISLASPPPIHSPACAAGPAPPHLFPAHPPRFSLAPSVLSCPCSQLTFPSSSPPCLPEMLRPSCQVPDMWSPPLPPYAPCCLESCPLIPSAHSSPALPSTVLLVALDFLNFHIFPFLPAFPGCLLHSLTPIPLLSNTPCFP